jgi:hypothetical protein
MVNCAVTSFVDARTLNGICYKNFQLAAVARGLVTERDHAFQCYRQHMTEATAFELRGLFASMTLNGLPTAMIYEDLVLRRFMMTDYLDMRNMSLEISNQHLLLDLAALLKREDKLLSDCQCQWKNQRIAGIKRNVRCRFTKSAFAKTES